jgi:signal peptidase II
MNLLINLKKRKIDYLNRHNLLFLIIVIVTFSLDRISKFKIINNFNESTYFINDFINFDLIWNIGIGFGLLSTSSSILYEIVTLVIGLVILILTYISITSDKFDKYTFAIVIGGALGNFYDRLIYNAVPDFIDLHYANFHWFTFNVADIFISLGIIFFIMKGYFVKN